MFEFNTLKSLNVTEIEDVGGLTAASYRF